MIAGSPTQGIVETHAAAARGRVGPMSGPEFAPGCVFKAMLMQSGFYPEHRAVVLAVRIREPRSCRSVSKREIVACMGAERMSAVEYVVGSGRARVKT